MAKRQGFFNKLIMGSDNMPDFTPSQLPTTRWGLFRDVFKNRLFELFKLSLWGDLFLLPLVFFLFVNYLNTRAYNIYIPYDANIGIGYPVELDAALRGQQYAFMSEIQKYLVLIPLIMLFCLGLSGSFYVVRRLIWGEDVSVTRHFFKGIKDNWRYSLVAGLLFSLSLFIMMYTFLTNGMLDSIGFWNVLVSILGVIQFILVCGVTLFMLCQSVTYKLKLLPLLTNSFVFGLALVIQNTFFIALAALPVLIPEVLALFSVATRFTVAPILYIIYAFLGTGYSALVLMVYANYVFDKYLNDRVEGAKKNRGMYVRTPEEEKQAEIERIKTRNVVYGSAYVARKLSSIDQGTVLTPLQSSYSRSDLERLNAEKELLKKELEEERTRAEAEVKKEIEQFEAEQNKKEKGKKKK